VLGLLEDEEEMVRCVCQTEELRLES